MEGMLARLPVVATDVQGNRDLVVDGKTGFLVPYGDTERIALALSTLLEDPDLRNRMGRAGRARVLSEFDETEVVRRITKTYDQLWPDNAIGTIQGG